MINLLDELHSFPPVLDPAQLPANLPCFLPKIGITPIEVSGSLWQPAGRGLRAVIIPICDGDEAPRDLLAIFPRHPGRWFWRIGSAIVLGTAAIRSAHTWGTPLHLFAHPLAWLVGRCNGACLLTDDAVHCLLGVTEVTFDDLALAERVDAAFRQPPAAMPRLLIARRAAA